MSLNRNEKAAVVSEVAAQAGKSQTLAIAEYRGLTVEALNKLRIDARSKGVYLHVLKNTLARRAVAGTPFEPAAELMVGPLIYGFSEDAVAAAKVVADFAKSNDKLEKSVRNLEAHQYLPPEGVNVYDLLRHDHLVVSRDAIKAIELRLNGSSEKGAASQAA